MGSEDESRATSIRFDIHEWSCEDETFRRKIKLWIVGIEALRCVHIPVAPRCSFLGHDEREGIDLDPPGVQKAADHTRWQLNDLRSRERFVRMHEPRSSRGNNAGRSLRRTTSLPPTAAPCDVLRCRAERLEVPRVEELLEQHDAANGEERSARFDLYVFSNNIWLIVAKL